MPRKVNDNEIVLRSTRKDKNKKVDMAATFLVDQQTKLIEDGSLSLIYAANNSIEVITESANYVRGKIEIDGKKVPVANSGNDIFVRLSNVDLEEVKNKLKARRSVSQDLESIIDSIYLVFDADPNKNHSRHVSLLLGRLVEDRYRNDLNAFLILLVNEVRRNTQYKFNRSGQTVYVICGNEETQVTL